MFVGYAKNSTSPSSSTYPFLPFTRSQEVPLLPRLWVPMAAMCELNEIVGIK